MKASLYNSRFQDLGKTNIVYYITSIYNRFNKNVYNFRNDAAPPVFEQIFKNARFAQGGNAIFEGKVTGIPKPFVSWTRKGAPLLGK